MKIKEISNEHILFDNDNEIWFDHQQDCCEYNYADFSQLEESALSYDFKEDLIFEMVGTSGFRFGDNLLRMFYIPCYSWQSGEYMNDIEIYYNSDKVIYLESIEIYDK